MKIEEKLALSRSVKEGKVIGIQEGLFIRFYNESLYAWQQWVKAYPELPMLKVNIKSIKKLDGQIIVYGGLPLSVLEKRAIELGEDGIVVIQYEADMSGWQEWYESQTKVEDKQVLVDNQDDSQCFIRLYLPKSLIGRIQSLEVLGCDETSQVLSEVKHFITFK